MNDTLTVKPIVSANVTGTVLNATARDFSRIFGPENGLRLNNALGSLNPSIVRISHQARKSPDGVQRSLLSLEQTRTRLDTASNPIRKDVCKVKFQIEVPGYISEAEFVADVELLLGTLAANSCAVAKELYYGGQ